jgi:hypothetical protein
MHPREGPAQLPETGSTTDDHAMGNPIVFPSFHKTGTTPTALIVPGLLNKEAIAFLEEQRADAKLKRTQDERLIAAMERLTEAATSTGIITKPKRTFLRAVWRSVRWWWALIIPAAIAALISVPSEMWMGLLP